MPQHLAHVALLVRDYDEALAHFVDTLTDDLARDHEADRTRGVRFIETPRDEVYSRVVVFEDLYGNRWDLVEPRIT